MDRETNTTSIFIFIVGFVFGILVSSFVFIAPLVSFLIFITGFIFLIAEKIWTRKINKEVLFLSLIIMSFGLGVFRYSVKDFHISTIPTTTGVIVSEPEQRENTTRFIMQSDNGEKVLVNTDLYSPVQYGDSISIKGKLQKPGIIDLSKNLEQSSNRPFDYGKFLSKDDIYYIFSFTEVTILSSGHGNSIKRILFGIKKSFVSKIKEILAEPYSSLLSGLLVSGREAMPKDILEDFRRAGIIHIVVLSGYNITIIAEFMRRMFQNLFILIRIRATPRAAAIASVFGIISFVLMTGAEATVVRASIMVLTVIVAKMFGRGYSASRALLIAGFIMLLGNPKILVFDPSFQLSFLATLALIYVVPIVDRYLKIIPERWGIRMIVSTTIATQITVLPLLIYSMGDFSLVSLPANILVLLIIPLTMFIGFIATIIGYVSYIFALPFAYMVQFLLSWILGVSNFLGNLKFASIKTPSLSLWLMILIYLIIIIFVMRLKNSSQHSAN